MTFLLVFLATLMCVFLLRNPLRKAPVAFYALAVVVDVLFMCGDTLGLPRAVDNVLFMLVHKCALALALFTIVMFIGAFSRESKVRRWLQPVRAELSIVACILSLGHMTVYLANYAIRFLAGAVDGAVFVALVVALVLFALILVLGVTSFQFVKRRMTKASWKRVQLFSYVFFGLTYVHLMLMLLPPALQGGSVAQLSVAVYSVVFAGYAIARLTKAARDRRCLSVKIGEVSRQG